VSIWNALVYIATLDAHLVALEARTGRVRWDVELGKTSDHLNLKQPPLVVGHRLFVGSAGGDEGGRGFIDAYDAATGRQLWRFSPCRRRASRAARRGRQDKHGRPAAARRG
jgi:alcohol dehydrogenase (cytochrome c)